jgi:hypothetical protein
MKEKFKLTYLVEEPAAAGIAGAAIGDVGEPDGFFWSSSDDSKEAWPACLRGRPRDSLREAELALLQNSWRHYVLARAAESRLSARLLC